MQQQIRLIIAEDHNLVRDGIRRILQNSGDVLVVGEATDGEEAVKMAAALRPDVVLMDITMPRLNGLDATRRIKARDPETAVLVVTAHDESPLVAKMLEAGAGGYLLKTASAEELLGAVRAVRSGGTILSSSLSHKAFGSTARPRNRSADRAELGPLTEREAQVLRLAARGLSNKAIARELCLSPRTVGIHLYHIFSKLEASSRTEAVTAGIARGWVRVESAA